MAGKRTISEVSDEDVRDIVAGVANYFPVFGGGRRSELNPLADFLKDKPPMFAMGVDVEAVVRFVITQRSAKKRLIRA